MKDSPEEAKGKDRKGKKRMVLWVALGVFAAYVLHLYIIYGSFEFITDIFQGDLVRIGSLILTVWVIGGWYLLSRLFKNL